MIEFLLPHITACLLFNMWSGNVWWIIFTHSSLLRSCVSLTRSLKQPKECMLSSTSGSSSAKDRILFTHTRRGGGCSGQGSLRPPLTGKHQCTQLACAIRNTTDIPMFTASIHRKWGPTLHSFKAHRGRSKSKIHNKGRKQQMLVWHGIRLILATVQRPTRSLLTPKNF